MVFGTFSGGLGTAGRGSTAPRNSDDSSTVTQTIHAYRNVLNKFDFSKTQYYFYLLSTASECCVVTVNMLCSYTSLVTGWIGATLLQQWKHKY